MRFVYCAVMIRLVAYSYPIRLGACISSVPAFSPTIQALSVPSSGRTWRAGTRNKAPGPGAVIPGCWQGYHRAALAGTKESFAAERGKEDVSGDAANSQSAEGGSSAVALVRRNRQSMAFRQGTPLVFSGAIESTFANVDSIPMAYLVLVAVSPNKAKDFSKPRRRKGPKSGKGESAPHKVLFREGSEETPEMLQQVQMLKQSQDIGYGVYNPNSMYRVRILCHSSSHAGLFREVNAILQSGGKDSNQKAIAAIVRTKVCDAARARLAMNLPSDSTDSYRLVNGEGDGLSGLAVDILGGKVAVVMSSAAWCEEYRETIVHSLEDAMQSQHPSYTGGQLEMIWRNTPSRLKQDGYLDFENGNADNYNDTCVVVKESNVLYNTYPFSKSQKTGFYCDQRNNRLDVAKLCNGKRVLDLCCYNGGFALNAMVHGGADQCIGVDSSQDAIEAATSNAELNGIDEGRIQFVKDDIAKYMQTAYTDGASFDVVVLDPPKLAPSASGLDRAARKYRALNRDAIKLVNREEGGLLLTCTCSGAMTQKEGGTFFLQTVKEAAMAAGRQVTLLQKSGAAPCHTQCPASFPAGNYLTAALFYVSPV